MGRVEELPVVRLQAATGAAVQDDDGLPVASTAFLDVQRVHGRDRQPVRRVRLNGRVQMPAQRRHDGRATDRLLIGALGRPPGPGHTHMVVWPAARTCRSGIGSSPVTVYNSRTTSGAAVADIRVQTQNGVQRDER